jgi:hypothetical protein
LLRLHLLRHLQHLLHLLVLLHLLRILLCILLLRLLGRLLVLLRARHLLRYIVIGEGGVAVENWSFPEANPLPQSVARNRPNKTKIMNLSNLSQFHDFFWQNMFKSIDHASRG